VTIGVDFDNTIISHDAVFHQIALEMGLVDARTPRSKAAVRDAVLATRSNDEWTVLQAHVYGARMRAAAPYPGVKDFFQRCRALSIPVHIVSHKTQYAAMGPRDDLRRSALDWLEEEGFFAADGIGLPCDRVHFASTRQEKLERITNLRCTQFVDDLPEVLDEPDFPAGVGKVLFDPNDIHEGWTGGRRIRRWTDLSVLLDKPHAVQLG
jgi:hypothetical protein